LPQTIGDQTWFARSHGLLIPSGIIDQQGNLLCYGKKPERILALIIAVGFKYLFSSGFSARINNLRSLKIQLSIQHAKGA